MKRIVFRSINCIDLEEYTLVLDRMNSVEIEHQYSLISAGTELFCLTGQMGEFKNLIPGYSGVGSINQNMYQDSQIGIGRMYQDTEAGKSDDSQSSVSNDSVYFTSGTHSSHIHIPLTSINDVIIKIDKELAMEATFLPLGKVAFHGLKRINIQLGEWTVVYGLGIVGNLSAQLASIVTGNKVICVDPIQLRRKVAENMGFITINPMDENYCDKIKELTGGGADSIIETSGNPLALNDSFKIAAYGARVSLVAGHYSMRELDLKTDFQNKEISLVGARRVDLANETAYDKWTVRNYMMEFYSMIKRGVIDVKPLITHIISPSEAPAIYKKLAEKDESVLGVVIDWNK